MRKQYTQASGSAGQDLDFNISKGAMELRVSFEDENLVFFSISDGVDSLAMTITKQQAEELAYFLKSKSDDMV